MKNKRRVRLLGGIIVCVILVVACLGGQASIRLLFASPIRRALPWTAREVHEWQWNEPGLTGQDYTYLVKARISERQFDAYVDRLDLSPHSPDRDYEHSGFSPNWDPHLPGTDQSPVWWDPSASLDGTYVYDGGSWWIVAKWENGIVYAVSYCI